MGAAATCPLDPDDLAKLRGSVDDACARAAGILADADFVLVHAGAGMSADSGLPTYEEIAPIGGVSYRELATPESLASRPALVNELWASSWTAYRAAAPHSGYGVLRQWAASRWPDGRLFVATTNVDSLFEDAAVVPRSALRELHGSLRRWQCAALCSGAGPTWELTSDAPTLDPAAQVCPDCAGPGRPRIKLFGDDAWLDDESEAGCYHAWWDAVEDKLASDPAASVVVVEIGVGTHVRVLRAISEHLVGSALADAPGRAHLIRINPLVPHADAPALNSPALVPVAATAAAALEKINACILALAPDSPDDSPAQSSPATG